MGAYISYLFGLDPIPDASGEGYEPSSFSRMLAVPQTTNFKQIEFTSHYTGNKKVLVLCCEQRYLTMANGNKFSTGNHPVETLLPLMHLQNAGFEFDVVTPTGQPVVLEMWAMPTKDTAVLEFYNTHKTKFDKPTSLQTIIDNKQLDNYIAFFGPGGHGAMIGLPEDDNVGKLIRFAKEKDLYFVTVCHGPAILLAAAVENKGDGDQGQEEHPYSGYGIACFPDSMDKQVATIGYLPGPMPWFFGEKLVEKCNVSIVNTGADATVHADRKLLTGASPKACQALGIMAAEKLLEEFA
jgi:molecular chaperone Hsp31 and glyoxalase 3